MGKESFLKINRRRFLQAAGALGAASMFSNPLKLFAADTGLSARNDLNITSNTQGATGHVFEMLDFAHVSDVHIVDNGNKLRFEEILSLGLEQIDPNLFDFNGAVSRNQDFCTARIWDVVIRSINSEHANKHLDFLMNTGDSTDTNFANELRWSIEIANGYLSQDYYDRVEEQNGTEDILYNLTDIAGLKIPWYAAIGNHDTEYQGTANNVDAIAQVLSLVYGNVNMEEALCSQQTAINTYLNDTEGLPLGHGFANMPEPPDGYTIKEGYYSFDPTHYIHCVVLNTSNYRPEVQYTGIPSPIGEENFAGGFLDQRQLDWMKQDITANSDKLCLVFSHSPDPTIIGSDITTAFTDVLLSYPQVIAHINGHSHQNKITAIKQTSGSGGYWSINTCSVIEWPQEWRRITVKDNGDGTGSIICRMFRHNNQECLAAAEVNLTEDQGVFIGNQITETVGQDPATPEELKASLEGTESDRNVELVFAISATVARDIRATYNSDVDECFIATAAYGSLMEPEVVSLRRFRDATLKKYSLGRLFIKTYYRLSPPVARFISKRPALRALARGIIKPVVYIIQH